MYLFFMVELKSGQHLLYALGTINVLFDKRFEPHITPDTICTYFNTRKSTTYQKSKKIRDMFAIKYGDKEFSTPYILENDPLSHLMIPKSIIRVRKLLKKLTEIDDQELANAIRKQEKDKDQSTLKQLELSDFE